MSEERDELFQLMLGRTTTKAVERILAAGYRKPRTITTVAELDALRFESVVIDAYNTPYVCESHRTDGTCNGWRMSGGSDYLLDSDAVLFHGEVTVLWEPTA